MKRKLLALAFTCFLALAYTQAQGLTDINRQRLEKQRISMLILGGWAVGNIALGATLATQREGEGQYFHAMNAGWNLVNLGLAAAGYLSAVKADPAAFGLYATISEQHKLQKIFLFNAGLDVGYMMGGLYLMERSKNTANKPERLKGFGKSILLQGAFLFAFDLGAFLWQAQGNGDLQPLLEGLSFTGNSVGWVLRF
ncbi:MAG: hypothetical protein H6557_33080 [Lewinellaceae bacterium]|nr:hypothetical protein [Phaeodactylibacter sp.]MCB9041479.1 hypothetical protein [Lewinellaceae bacterium]